ncbi:hypothetical protein GO013_06575 [Pseudodesulfovibrio sp. JC047]|uniref:hypothetical protein n=1 Tax=Pseudodesulfovibrio sp. JC047 TaxID=2683199 RepID=UPI0013D44F33|nr:hypothetical protein [Pseudodesulfovibrio sp. JC047]NDV19084.1 hypothetical protein [Pseudodesulfovibrio sp. JC047]
MTDFVDPIWGLLGTFAFILLGIVICAGFCLISNRQQLKAMEMMKELAEQGIEFEKSQNMNKTYNA